ncbi:WD domain, Gbeta repeat-containing protein [Acanthamoeba castellanii str. Neff]|uniref:WD domain, Gbeta repeat-containing protein n=1 Tax=Acanthamoeba castellanii (strain ATCC 30010 / Neff) TaxID=1257118 RepID=L8GG16_ACACF|nr:WD domain, Gbeta repeat-containing protein [Acanthamoeba castellanii str. Neff]ELR11952.1 WD domain, Gbeta repeat-containing protein [Acanthamoeba castellanii str. Neff]
MEVETTTSAAATQGVADEEVVARYIRNSLKRTYDLFLRNHHTFAPLPENEESERLALFSKIQDEYEPVRNLQPPAKRPAPSATNEAASQDGAESDKVERVLQTLPSTGAAASAQQSSAVVAFREVASAQAQGAGSGFTSMALAKRGLNLEKPEWHAPWKLMRVISGHLGWVRSVAVDPGNEWFVTGSADRTIKIWDLASGTLKLTLTGHINSLRGLAVSPRHPYLFSASEDKMVKCWDLEYNKVIRHYHGHLSGVYCLSLHPTIDVLVTGGRDSTARVWDMRTKNQVHCLSSHAATVVSIITQATDPQVVTGSMDSTVKLWDLAAGKAMCTLTNHKKGVRAMAMHPREYTFASASADNIKKWKLPKGDFLHNLPGHNTIVHSMAINEDGVLVTGGDDGSLCFWDWKTGHLYQRTQTIVQPGSLDCEAAVYAMTFDQTGSRLITCEADKTIKVWKEDEDATEETHPVQWKPSRAVKRY